MGKLLRQLRWQIAAAYTLLILLALGGLGSVLFVVTRTAYQRTLEAGVAGQARLVAALVENLATQRADVALESFVDELGRTLDARVTVIDASGRIQADSLIPPERYADQRVRPEVAAALDSGVGETARYSTATGDERFYVAVPIGADTMTRGVARVGVPLATIAAAQTQIGLAVFVAVLLAAAVAVVLAVLVARRTTRPLRELGAMAGRLAAGDLDVRVPIPPDAEVAALAESFNQMASRLRQQIDARSRESERLTAILATMDDGILILDPDTRVTLANRAARDYLALSEQPPFAMRSVAGGVALAEASHALLATPSAAQVTVDELRSLPSDRALRAIVTRLGEPRMPQTLIVLQDLTELRRAERSRRTLLANITHDLRTPLASLQALLDALADGAIDEPNLARDFLDRMGTEVAGLSRLVQDFLELSRIEQGELKLELTPASPALLLAAAAARIEAQAHQRGIAVVTETKSLLPAVLVDVSRIEQVLLNLLQNALAATGREGLITLSATAAAACVELTVSDTGSGIATADLPHIFERFYKADTARSGGGTGLGLAIARHLVEHHGGELTVESTPGIGSRFTIRLPAARAAFTEGHM